MFLICTYLDGDRWESGLEPLLYPNGISFYRPFSYRQNYFHPEQLAGQLKEPSQSKSLLQTNWNEGFFGVRFHPKGDPDFIPIFVPLRKVELVGVNAAGQINLDFRLAQYVRPLRRASNGPSFLPKLNLTGILPEPRETKLFIDPPEAYKATIRGWELDDQFPPEMWDALLRTVSPAARLKILDTVVLRLIRIRKRGESAAASSTEIDTKNHIWGTELREKTAYDLLLEYFRIKEPGTDTPPIQYQYLLTNPESELQASRRTIQINANYRNEEIWIDPKSPGPGPIHIALEPCTVGDKKLVDPKSSKTIGLKFPVLVKPLKWPTERKINLAIALASIFLTLLLLRNYMTEPEPTQKVILVLIAGTFSVAVTAFKDVALRRS